MGVLRFRSAAFFRLCGRLESANLTHSGRGPFATAVATARPAGFGVIWTTVALDLVGFGIVLPVLPLYAERFGADARTIGLLVATFSLGQFVFSPIWGRVSDRVGRKPVLLVSLVGTCIGSLLTGLAGSLALLFIARIIDGISGASVSVAQAAVTDIAEPQQRPRLLGLLGAAFGVGFVVGPALGALAALGSPKLPFFIAAAIAGVNAVVAWFRLPETKPATAPVPAPSAETTRPAPTTWTFVLIAFLALVAFSGFEATFALLGERRLDLTISSTGAVFVVIGVVLSGVQARLVGPLTERIGELRTLQSALVVNTLGLLLLVPDEGWTLLVPGLLLLVVGQGLLTPTLASLVAGRAHHDRRGEALGLQQSAGGLARVVGPVVGGLLFHAATAAPFAIGGALVGVAALVASTVRVPAAPTTVTAR